MTRFFSFLFLTFLFSFHVLANDAALKAAALNNQTPQFHDKTRTQLLPGEVGSESLLESLNDGEIVPYGANLFSGGYESERIDGLSDDYIVASGDKLNIWTWGAVNFAELVTVDNQGNIFLPKIGPIRVAGQRASQVNKFVTGAITKVYKKGVQVYVTLLSATPVSVYIAGNVMRPGQYAGLPGDTILYFLKRAGGIDNNRGSYRKIRHLRENSVLGTYDLYDFMSSGALQAINFKDGDTLFIEPIGAQVNVSGNVRYPFAFELDRNTVSGREILELVRVKSNTSHVGISGDRKQGPFSTYLPLEEFKTVQLEDGDSLLFNDDLRADVLDIKVSGSYTGPSYYSVKKKTRLRELLATITVDEALADVKSIYVKRQSVAIKQKQALEESLQRLERSVFTAPASSSGEASIRAKEAELVMEFVRRARTIKPSGRVVVSDGKNIANVLLETGDEIVIPEKTDLVLVSGEVLIPQAIVYNPKATVEDYIHWAGGYTERAEKAKVPVLKANGLFDYAASESIKSGDQIIVLPKIDSKNMQLVKDLTQIIYQIAIAGSVIDRLND